VLAASTALCGMQKTNHEAPTVGLSHRSRLLSQRLLDFGPTRHRLGATAARVKTFVERAAMPHWTVGKEPRSGKCATRSHSW
jgi:hypothetical protein